MTLGQEFDAFTSAVRHNLDAADTVAARLCEINPGGTAIGTGINSSPNFADAATSELRELTGLPLVPARDLLNASWDLGIFVVYSSWLKQSAVTLSKIANDLRLLSSGPRAGFGEIALPGVQAGSSIMPGKVNPVMPEAINQIAYQVIGNDLAITMAAEAGQFQLDAMEPVITFNLFFRRSYLRMVREC